MNTGQKVLTIVMLVVFVSLTVAAATDPSEHAPLAHCVIVWVTVGVIYSALFFVMASKRK